jgi:glutathione S-transferase
MKIYDWRLAPNPRRVRMYLAEKGLDVPIEEVGVPGKFHLKPEFVARFDPYATAPTLELDDGTCVSEAMAICRYFEDLHPEPRLMGKTALDKAVVEMWERRAYEGAMFAITEMLRNTHPEFLDRGLPGTAEKIVQIEGVVERGQGRLRRFSTSADKQLAKNRFMTGDSFSVADITAFCAIDFLGRAMKVPIATEHANVRRWYEDIQKRASVEASA